MSATKTRTIAAGQSETVACLGHYLNINSCDLPLLVSLDGGEPSPMSAGQQRGDSKTVFRAVTFKNANAISVDVTFTTGDEPSAFVPSNNQQRIQSTLSHGSTLSPTNNAGVWITIPTGWQRRQRKQIVFTLNPSVGSPGNSDYVAIVGTGTGTPETEVGMYVTLASPLTAETDSAFRCWGSKSGLALAVLEIYYNQGAG